ncbi:SDR family oxidoreductase [Paenibacillus sp. RC67]|uniref:SDR family oxidoreductase n=1 Tax=Paenibacillus sp. RC67 TaxID=3039392 RepID=UPI0024AE4DA0|nr:SDR family oxidoreductase [Paenibacillus sp. RC67]
MRNLKGKLAVVTGVSRRSGIGTAICRSFAKEGADIFFTHWTPYDSEEGCGVDEDWPNMLREELQTHGVRVGHMEANLSDPEGLSTILDHAEEAIGVPTILVNNACHCAPSTYLDLNASVLDQHYAVNVRGTFLLSTEFAKRFEQKHAASAKGRIINLVSKGPDPNNLAYTATKGAVIAWTEPLSVGLAPLGITVNCVDPGPTDSGWMTEEIKKTLLPRFPMGRIGRPEDAAELITFLAGDQSQWVTGQIIRSEGGYTGR